MPTLSQPCATNSPVDLCRSIERELAAVTAERDALKKDLADAHGIAQASELRAEHAEAERDASRIAQGGKNG